MLPLDLARAWRWLRPRWWPSVFDDLRPDDRGRIRYLHDTAQEPDIGVRYAVWLLGLALMTLNVLFCVARWCLRPRPGGNALRWRANPHG